MMNFNLIAYLIYGLITLFTIFFVGGILHKNGRYYIHQFFSKDPALGDYINDGLLIGYYLINMGYVFITIRYWENIESFQLLVELIGTKTGSIFLLLGLLHFFNILALKVYAWWHHIEIGPLDKKS